MLWISILLKCRNICRRPTKPFNITLVDAEGFIQYTLTSKDMKDCIFYKDIIQNKVGLKAEKLIWHVSENQNEIKASSRLPQKVLQTNSSRPNEISGLEFQPRSSQTIDSSCTETSPFIWTPKRLHSRAFISQQLKPTYAICPLQL